MKLLTVEHWLAAYDKVSSSENANTCVCFLYMGTYRIKVRIIDGNIKS